MGQITEARVGVVEDAAQHAPRSLGDPRIDRALGRVLRRVRKRTIVLLIDAAVDELVVLADVGGEPGYATFLEAIACYTCIRSPSAQLFPTNLVYYKNYLK